MNVQSFNQLYMVHLSKKTIDKNKLAKLYRILFEITSVADDENEYIEIIKDIISPSEQIMIAKRIAIIYLLIKGLEQTVIAKYLNVSRATVAKFYLLFYEKEGKIIQVIKSLLGKEKITHFLDDLFADIFIQPGIKIGHWKIHRQHQRQKEERKMLDV